MQNQPQPLQQPQFPGSFVTGYALGTGQHPQHGKMMMVVFVTEQGPQHFVIPLEAFKKLLLEAQATASGIVVAK